MESVKIRCSEGVFTKEEFLSYLGISSESFKKYITAGKKNGQSEEEVIEDLILCSKLKKKYNLRRFPVKEKIVKYHDTYYPSVSYWAKMNNWSKNKVISLFDNGLTLEEIESTCKYKEEKRRSEDELYAFYKSREDDKVKISKSDRILIDVLGGKTYTSVKGLAKDYGISNTTINKRLDRGCSFSQAIGLVEIEKRVKSFSFLGLKFESITEFSNYYNIRNGYAGTWLAKYGLAGLEKLFIWLDSAEKESGINLPSDFKWDYLLKISSRLNYNKEDIVYQIKNLDKLDDGCNYYFGGKSYKRLTDVFAEYSINNISYGYKMFLKEKVPLYVIADIVAGVNIPKLSYKSPSTYLYFYYRDTFHSLNIDYEIDDIRDHLKKGYTADEILSTRKNCLSLIESTVNRKHFIQSKLNGIISKERMIGFFNSTVNKGDNHTLSIKKAFLQYSEVGIIKEAYRVSDTEYFLCKEGSELKYLSGTELLDIALESVKGKIGSDGENN